MPFFLENEDPYFNYKFFPLINVDIIEYTGYSIAEKNQVMTLNEKHKKYMVFGILKIWQSLKCFCKLISIHFLPFIKSVKYYHNHPKNYCHFKIEQTFFFVQCVTECHVHKKLFFFMFRFPWNKKSDTLKMQVQLESNNTKMCVHSLEQL